MKYLTDFIIKDLRSLKVEFSKRPLFLLALIVVLVSFLYANFFYKSKPLPYKDKENVTFTGTVLSIEADNSGLVSSLDIKADIPGRKRPNCVCYVNDFPLNESDVFLGSEVMVSGSFRYFRKDFNHGEFDAFSYRENRGYEFYVNMSSLKTLSVQKFAPREFFHKLKRIFCKSVLKYCPLEGSIVNTLLFGERSGLSKERKELFKYANLSHFLVLSGLHFSLAGGGIYILIRKSGMLRRYAALFSILFVFFYAALAGFGVSVIRAVIMFSVRLFADVINRSYDILSALSLSAIITLLLNPLYINDPAFIYSYAAVAAIALYFTYLFRPLRKERYKYVLVKYSPEDNIAHAKEYLSVPVILYVLLSVFTLRIQSYSNLLSIPVNLLLGALSGPVITLCALAFLCSLLGLKVPAAIFDFLIALIMRILDKLSMLVSKADIFKIIYSPSFLQAIIYIFSIVLLAFVLRRFLPKMIQHIVLLSVAILCLSPVKTSFSSAFLYVGQGNCTVVRLSKRNALLFDGGSTSRSDVGKNVILPYLMSEGITHIEDIYLSHEDADHINGIGYLIAGSENIKVKRIVFPAVHFSDKGNNSSSLSPIDESSFNEIFDVAKRNNVKTALIQAGGSICYDKVSLLCLWPDGKDLFCDPNKDSAVLWLKYKDFDMLIPGDATSETEERIQKNIPKADVYICAHHGSRYSSNAKTLELLSPSLTVISCGKDNRYGHPHKETLERLRNVGSIVLRTDECGTITVTPTRKGLKVQTYLKTNSP